MDPLISALEQFLRSLKVLKPLPEKVRVSGGRRFTESPRGRQSENNLTGRK